MRAAVRDHPRHVVLFSVIAGLLTFSRPAAALATAVGAFAVGLFARGPSWLPPAAVVAVAVGALTGEARVGAMAGRTLPALEGRVVSSRAVLLEPVRPRARGAAVRARLLDLGGEQAVLRLRAGAEWNVGVNNRDERSTRRVGPGVGDVIEVRGRVGALRPFETFQRRRGAAMAVEVMALGVTGERRGGVAGALDAVRRRAEAGLERGLAKPEAALLRGMVLGQDERLSEDVRADFRTSGLAHLLAVSGQNVMLLATLVFAVGWAVNATLRARLAGALVMIAVYVPLAGGGPSIQRAGVMGAAGLVAMLAGRPASRWYALGLAAAVTLALNPLAAGEPGWQLSFAAVVGLMAMAPPLREALRTHGWPGPLADAFALTTSATLFTAPLLAAHFGQVSLVSLAANLLAAPAVAPVMWLGMLAAAAAQLAPSLALPLNALNAPPLAFLQCVAHAAASVPSASAAVELTVPLVVAAYAVMSVVLLGASKGKLRLPRRSLPAAALAAIAVAVVAWPAPPAPPPRDALVVSFLDVGQGDATLLQRDGRSILFDTGPPDGPIVKRLREAGVERLDALVITHAQLDHEGAAPEVMRRFRPRAVLNAGVGWPTPVQRALHGRSTEIAAGQRLRVGRLHIHFLWPPPPRPGWRPDGDPNMRALVAHVRDGDFDLLLPADAESDVTATLDLPRVEALKVAHHGSEDPGLPALLTRLRPQVAAIEVGEGNRYGHPRPATLATLRATVPRVLRTDRDGTIRLVVRGGRMTVHRD